MAPKVYTFHTSDMKLDSMINVYGPLKRIVNDMYGHAINAYRAPTNAIDATVKA